MDEQIKLYQDEQGTTIVYQGDNHLEDRKGITLIAIIQSKAINSIHLLKPCIKSWRAYKKQTSWTTVVT